MKMGKKGIKTGVEAGKMAAGQVSTVVKTLRGKKGNEAAVLGKASAMSTGTAGAAIAIGVISASATPAVVIAAPLLIVAGITAYAAHHAAKTPEQLSDPFNRISQQVKTLEKRGAEKWAEKKESGFWGFYLKNKNKTPAL